MPNLQSPGLQGLQLWSCCVQDRDPVSQLYTNTWAPLFCMGGLAQEDCASGPLTKVGKRGECWAEPMRQGSPSILPSWQHQCHRPLTSTRIPSCGEDGPCAGSLAWGLGQTSQVLVLRRLAGAGR